jgi:hypothetical protein
VTGLNAVASTVNLHSCPKKGSQPLPLNLALLSQVTVTVLY